MDYHDHYPDMTPAEEEAAITEEALELVRWPIEDDGYEASLDAQSEEFTKE